MRISHDRVEANGVRLHYAAAGDDGPAIVFLHGFPEFWYAWKRQLAEFGRDHRAVAPDMRGYNLSSKPDAAEAYGIEHLVGDVRALADRLGHERFTLVGHDWGGIVAWAFAATHPARLDRLVIINAPHPAIFQRELENSPAQQHASAYMLVFRGRGAEARLSADGFAVFVDGILDPLVEQGHLTEEDKRAYLEAWSRPGALTGGLNYYRAAALGPAADGGSPDTVAALPDAHPARAVQRPIEVPTLVIWGERDAYLLPGNLDGLERYVTDLTVRRVPDASHWVVHERPELVNRCIREFLGRGNGPADPF